MQAPQAPSTPSAPADAGFHMPAADTPPDGLTRIPPGTTPEPIVVQPMSTAPETDTSTRDLAIGGAVFLVLLVIYFFVRNAYVHHLVVKRVAPSSASSAGWLLFLGLGFISAAAALAIIHAKFLSVVITAPLVIVGIIALIAGVVVGRRR